MGGQKDAPALPACHEVAQDTQYFLAGHGVEPGRGLVENEQVSGMAERASQHEFHAHAA